MSLFVSLTWELQLIKRVDFIPLSPAIDNIQISRSEPTLELPMQLQKHWPYTGVIGTEPCFDLRGVCFSKEGYIRGES